MVKGGEGERMRFCSFRMLGQRRENGVQIRKGQWREREGLERAQREREREKGRDRRIMDVGPVRGEIIRGRPL